MMFLIPTVAYGDVSSDPYKTPSINGYTYSFTSEVWTRSISGAKTVEASTFIRASANVPSGYMGGQARLYTSAGELWVASSMTYNTSKIAGFGVDSPRAKTKGTYYALTRAQFYNGNGYTSYTGYRSPNFDFLSLTLNNESEYSMGIVNSMMQNEYDVNDNGETYGSALSDYTIGVEPDLISAIGTNGIKGYVKSTDLTPNYNSPEEAIEEQMVANGDTRIIPLYDYNGTTILGEFELVTNYRTE